jgi:hypothetical protein
VKEEQQSMPIKLRSRTEIDFDIIAALREIHAKCEEINPNSKYIAPLIK